MPEPSLSALASVLRPFVTSVFGHALRLSTERHAGQVPLTQPSSIMDELLNETLDRIRGGSIDLGWWQSLLDRFGQQYITPDFLRKPALREWLAEEPVANDFKTIAAWRILASAQDEAAPRDRLAQSYSDRTGEAHYLAARPIDVVVAILVAGYIGAIRAEERAVAGMMQTGISRIDERLDGLSRAMSSVTDPITRQAHTEHAEKELARILALRGVDPGRSRSDIQKLLHRLDSDDLAAADEEVKHDVRYWTSRLCASDVETLDIARELGAQIRDDDPDRDLSIVDALICEMDGDSDGAIRFLRDRDDPDSRTALFGVLARTRGASTALDEFAESMAAGDAGFFTAVGWRNWTNCMTEVGRWKDAADRLARIDGTWSEAPVLAFVEGIVNSQLLLPAERRSATGDIRIFAGISPIQGEQAESAYVRATACFELARSGLQEIEDTDFEQFLTHWRRWLQLMDPNERNARNAHDEIRQDLERDNPDVKAMPFAWAFGVSFKSEPLRRYLSRREKLGGLNEDELRAECLLFLTGMDSGTISGRDFLRYLETRQKRLARVMPDDLLKAVSIDALVRDNQTERARALLAEMRDGLEHAEAMRLSAMIDSHEGRDPRRELERTYRETDDIIDLRNLVECLKQADDKEALLPLLQDLVARHRTAANVMDLMVCLSGRPFFNHRRIVELLDSSASYADLVEQSLDLKVAKAWALFHSGRLSDARELNDQLLSSLHAANSFELDINIAVATGDWERLPVIVEREWPRRDDHTAETLLRLAQIAAHQGQSPNRALTLAKLATNKAPDDAHVLAASYWLHFQLGRDEEADPAWLSRALELSSADGGPLWSVDFRTVVTEWMPERRERLAEIEANWLGGEIPTGIAASLLNVSLARLLIQIPEFNTGTTDRRMSGVVPVVFGGRPSVELDANWTVGLDITSILVLYYLGLLESIFEVFHRIKLSPDVMHYLFQERDRVRFHQPSRIRDSQQVRVLCNQHRLRVADDIETPPGEIADEVGRDLAELLQAARQVDGKVVCVFPIYQPNSLMEKEADTAEWNDLIVSVPDLCRLLHVRGGIDADTHERAQLFLRSQGQVERGNQETSTLDGTIYLDGLALSYLQSAKVLDRIVAVGLDLRIHPDVLSHMDELTSAGESGEDLAAKIDGIRHVLRNAVESGRASYLPRKVDPEAPVQYRDDQFTVTRSLLAAASDCDALCIDDRFANSKGRFAVTEENERTLPIACVLDILGFLAGRGHLSPERLWTARHKLRSGGFVFIPFKADELVHWLKATPVENDQLTEGAELRAIRQSMVRTTTMGLTNSEETFALFVEVTQTCVSTIRSLWRDESLTMESATVLSDWIWRHLVVDAPGDRGNVAKEGRKAWDRESMLRRMSVVLLPSGIESPDRRTSYADWVDESVLRPLRQANSNLIDEALTSICNTIPDRDNNAEIFGNVFLAHLPESAREYLLTRYPGRTRRWGFERQRLFGLEADFAVVDQELFDSVKYVFSGMGAKSVRSTTGNEISVDLDPEDGNIFLVYSGVGSGNRKKIPDLAILSPDPQMRVTTARAMVDRFGPTAPDFRRLLSDLESREPGEAELAEVFREAAGGVAAVQDGLLRKVHFGQPIGTLDILPRDLAYFEKIVGPQSATRDPERYICDTLIPYRRALLDRDPSRGLDICCLGALRDDLCPGQWTTHIDDDAMWEALSACGADGAPISLLGALDVAVYRQSDERFREYAAQAVIKLCDDGFGRQQDTDFYRLLWIFTRFAFNRINLIENGSKQPGFWKRMCAWMQAQFIARALSMSPASIAMDSLEEWSMSNMALVGAYAELVDAREEPMLLFTERLPSSDMRCEVLGRLAELRSRHANEGRCIPQSEQIDRAMARAQEHGNWLKCFFPGPLEGHRRPVAPAPEELTKTLKEAVPDISLPASWHFIANASHLYTLGESELGAARGALTRMPHLIDEGEMQNNLLSLEVASIVAKTSRDPVLADAVADAVISVSTKVSNENDIWLILVICLQAAAAFEEHDAWFDWLEERLARIAGCLPGPPNRSVRIFLEHLDAMETILPIGSWFHRRARSIASAGTLLRP